MKCTGLMGRIFGHNFTKYGKVDGFDGETAFPLVSDEECFRLGEVPDNCRKWCSFEIRCSRCGAVMGEKQ